MGSAVGINATGLDYVKKEENIDIKQKIYIGIFFDGTGNNMVQYAVANKMNIDSSGEETKIDLNNVDCGNGQIKIYSSIKRQWNNNADAHNVKGTEIRNKGIPLNMDNAYNYSNIAILQSIYQGLNADDENRLSEGGIYNVRCYPIYIEGAGTKEDRADEGITSYGAITGGGYTGVVSLVSKAVLRVRDIIADCNPSNTQLHFDVFGFSRGATCARLFSYLVAGERNVIKCEKEFKQYYAKAFSAENYKKLYFLDYSYRTVDFLGIYETVSSIGFSTDGSFNGNVDDYGLYSPSEEKVKTTFHLCAMDEFRKNFSLTNIDSKRQNNLEIYMPGCHSDIGGGYVDGTYLFQLERYQGNREIMMVNVHNNEIEPMFDHCSKSGWYNQDMVNSPNTKENIISCNREIKSGYSNLTLKLMIDRTRKMNNIFEGRTLFVSIPHEYEISSNLLTIANQAASYIENNSGCFYFIPSEAEYKFLRQNYLHFSAYSGPWVKRAMSGVVSGVVESLTSAATEAASGALEGAAKGVLNSTKGAVLGYVEGAKDGNYTEAVQAVKDKFGMAPHMHDNIICRRIVVGNKGENKTFDLLNYN